MKVEKQDLIIIDGILKLTKKEAMDLLTKLQAVLKVPAYPTFPPTYDPPADIRPSFKISQEQINPIP